MTQDEPSAILVAGGTKGIGLGIAKRLARPGAHVFLSYGSDDDAARKAVAEVAATGATAHAVKADLGTEAGGRAVIDAVAKHVKRLDVLVHSAAVPNPGRLAEQKMDDIRRAIEVGGMALLYLVQPAMRLLGSGSTVLFLTGASTHLVLPNHGALAAAKALGDCFIRYLAIECASMGINFNSLGVGPVDTELFRSVAPRTASGAPMAPPNSPNGQPIRVEDVAEAAAFLVSPGGRMIRGQTLLVDGGMSTTVRGR